MTRSVTIEDVLPHRGTMLLIDTIVHVTDGFAMTQSTVASHWPLVRGSGTSPIVLIELAAQTAGIWFGWQTMQASLRADLPAPRGPQGRLVGVKRAHFFSDTIAVQSCITTVSKIVLTAQEYVEMSSTCHVGDMRVGEIKLQVLRAEATAFSGVSD